jgi:ABC-type multidrug transport system fused ATPase/permease subunit
LFLIGCAGRSIDDSGNVAEVTESQKQTKETGKSLSKIADETESRAGTIEGHADNISAAISPETKSIIDPDIKGIKNETKEMRSDSSEMKVLAQKLEQISSDLAKEQKKIDASEKNAKEYKKKIIEQTEEITKLKNENTKMIQNMLAWVSVLCVIGIGISLLIGFVLRTPVAFLVASGCAATLGVSIAVTIYMKSIGLVAIICMGVGLLVASVYVIMQIINRDKVVKDLVDTNEIAKQNLTAENKKKVFGGDDKPGLVEEIQSPITKQFVAKIRSVSKKNTKPNNT